MLNLVLVVGIISSLLFYEITEISPGGIIAPVYIAMYINNPQKIIATILLSILTYIFIKLLSNITIIYGRRKFAIYIIISIFLKFLLEKLILFDILLSANAIGLIIPAMIARDFEKQGFFKTVSSILIVAIFTKASVELIIEVSKLW